MDAYRGDLAYIHDAGYGDLARDAAKRLIEELTSTGHRAGTVVDLGCGSGILAAAASDAGYHVVGIDAAEAMVALARTRVPKADFRVGSFVSADLPRCVAVAAVGEVLNYLFDPANDDRARANLFRRVHDALVPGGVLLVDVAGPQRARPGGPRRTFATALDWAVLVETSFEPASGVLTRDIVTFRRTGDFYRRDEERHRLVLLDPDAVLRALRSAGFEAHMIPSYGTLPLPPGVVGFVGRRRS